MMSTRIELPIALTILCGALACSGSDTPRDGGDDAGGQDATVDSGQITPVDGGPEDAGFSEECTKPINLTKLQAWFDAQPVLGVRSRAILTVTSTFASLADDPTEVCSAELTFKDSNGNGTLEPYENWLLDPEVRAEDLVNRLTDAETMGLMLHPGTDDVPTDGAALSPQLHDAITTGNVRFLTTAAPTTALTTRATWANTIQELSETQAHGIPVVLSSEPSHMTGNGRQKAVGFSQWPTELGLAATDDLAIIEEFGAFVSQEYRAIGVRMLLEVSADLATEPRWYNSQFTYGEDSAEVADRVAAFVRGLQGEALGPDSVAGIVGHFPGAGAAKGGWNGRLEKGKFTTYPGNQIDAHLGAFQKALDVGVAGVMPAYAIPEQGSWSGLGGLINGSTVEQVGASFHRALITDVLRGHYAYDGLVLAPSGVLDDAGLDPFGAPWGMETQSKAERVAKAVNAGVDQFGGLWDTAPITAAVAASAISPAQLRAAAARALALTFKLGLFENPYVDPAMAPALANTDPAYRAGLRAMNKSLVLVKNAMKPGNWLNGTGDGTQTGDKGNAGNGTLKVLPAPPGEPYVAAGCNYFVAGNFDLDYIRSVSAGYGLLTNDVLSINDIPVETAADRMALSDYIFIRVDAPFTPDPDSGALGYPTAALNYTDANNSAQLEPIRQAKAAITAWAGPLPSQAQIIVMLDSGRPSVVQEILDLGVSALYVGWTGTLPDNLFADKVLMDVAFGITKGEGKLPVGLPLSNEAATTQDSDRAGDGQHGTFVSGFGIPTPTFE